MACQHIIVQSVVGDNILVCPEIQTQTIVIENIDGILGSVRTNTFETVSKNLNAYPSNASVVGGVLQSITYDLGNSLNIVKTLNYNLNNQLVNITLSGHLPSGIKTSKNITYDAFGYLSAVDYA